MRYTMSWNDSDSNSLDDRPLSEKIVRAVEDRESADVLDANPPLYDAVDPDSLDPLFENRDTDGSVEFGWRGYWITVSSDGSVDVVEDQ